MFKRFFMNRSLKSRIRFLYTLFAVVLVAGLTFYVYHFTVELLKEKEASVLSDSIDYLEREISARIKDVNEEFLNNFENAQFLKLYQKSVRTTNTISEQMKLNYNFKNYFFNIKVRNSDLIHSIQMIGSDKNVYSDEYNSKFDYEQFEASPYYESCMENRNKIQYLDLEPDAEYFSILRSFYFVDSEEGDTEYPGVGYLSENNDDYSTLIFLLKKKYLRNTIKEEAARRQTNILILDQEGNVVVQEGDADWLSEENTSLIIKEAKVSESDSFETRLENRQIQVQMQTIDIMHWDVVYIYDMNLLYQQAGQIRHVAVVIFIFAVFGVFLIASFISGTVVEPLHLLAKSMDEAVENNMEVSFEPKYNDEIAELGRRFCMLMQRVSALMTEVKRVEEQKRVQELKALQAQINPHFLYNTLDMVYWLAKIEKKDKIANLIADLADFFRLSLNKGEDITTVEREVEHVRKYLEIQKVRQDGKFDYTIHMEAEVRKMRVPKLILQPFVENTLIHGFETLSYQGRIQIAVTKEGNNIIFRITDNGCGIAKNKLAELNGSDISPKEKEGKTNDGKKSDYMEANSISGVKGQGYAIGNVRDRIHLYAGSRYGVRFDEEIEQGTRVVIWFPCEF